MNRTIIPFSVTVLAGLALNTAHAAVDLGPLSAEAAVSQTANAILRTDESSSSPTLEQIKATRLARVILPTPAPAKPAPAAAPPIPERDPTLISVPSNTLGPGEPLWLRSDRHAAEARIATAEADIAEREAVRSVDEYDDFVVYGPYASRGRAARGWYRNGLRPNVHRGVIKANADTSAETDDLFDQAQIRFGRIAAPPIGPIVQPQLDAQRKFGETARPPIVRIQNDVDQAQLRLRKGAPKPK